MMAWGYEKSFTIEHDNTLKKELTAGTAVTMISRINPVRSVHCIFRLTDTIYGEAADILN